jgi:hypothetical protein
MYGKVPAMVDVPETTPVVEITKPAGRPVAVKVYGLPVPPVPVMVTGVIAMPWMALMTTQAAVGGATTVTEQLSVPAFPSLSRIVTMYGKVPVTVDVPETTPVVEIAKPAGRPVAVKV